VVFLDLLVFLLQATDEIEVSTSPWGADPDAVALSLLQQEAAGHSGPQEERQRTPSPDPAPDHMRRSNTSSPALLRRSPRIALHALRRSKSPSPGPVQIIAGNDPMLASQKTPTAQRPSSASHSGPFAADAAHLPSPVPAEDASQSNHNLQAIVGGSTLYNDAAASIRQSPLLTSPLASRAAAKRKRQLSASPRRGLTSSASPSRARAPSASPLRKMSKRILARATNYGSSP
jgi:hypothetical protein